MLVLPRKRDEQLMIGDDICVTVVGLGGNRVQLGIEAPQEMLVSLIKRQGAGPQELPLAFDPTWPCLLEPPAVAAAVAR